MSRLKRYKNRTKSMKISCKYQHYYLPTLPIMVTWWWHRVRMNTARISAAKCFSDWTPTMILISRAERTTTGLTGVRFGIVKSVDRVLEFRIFAGSFLCFLTSVGTPKLKDIEAARDQSCNFLCPNFYTCSVVVFWFCVSAQLMKKWRENLKIVYIVNIYFMSDRYRRTT